MVIRLVMACGRQPFTAIRRLPTNDPALPNLHPAPHSPFTTPLATTPTPFSDTSLTLTRAEGLEDLRS